MLRELLKFKNKQVAGLDIGSTTIKLVKLALAKDQAELVAFHLEPALLDLEVALKKITQSQELKKVNISVSAPAAMIRYVNFPRMNEEELKQALRFEAQKHIPFAMSEVNLDTYILKQDLSDNKMWVLMAAVKKDFIDQRLKLLEEVGLRVNLVDIDSLALINAFNFNYAGDDNFKNKTVALLNIGASTSNLNILEGSIPRLSRDLTIAGNYLTQKLADTFGLDFNAAEKLKLNPDKEKASKMAAAIEGAISNLAGEVRSSFDYYESQGVTQVAKILLSGAGSLWGGLKDAFSGLLDIEVEYWDPLRQINLSRISAPEKAVANQLAVAVGLALRG